MLRFRTSTFAACALAALFAGCSREPAATPVATPPPDADATAKTVSAQSDPEQWPGAAVYAKQCASCHEGQVAKAPQKLFLQMLSGPTILDALEQGLMKSQAATLTADERKHVAEYLSGAPLAAQQVETPPAMCMDKASPFDAAKSPVKSGWGYHNARHVPTEIAGLTATDAPNLQLAWAFEFPRGLRARSQPSIAYGAVFVGSHDGHVYALDLATGCARWVFKIGRASCRERV